MAKIGKRIKPVYIVLSSILLLVIFLPGYSKFMELRSRNAYLEKEIERLERENIRLYNEREKLDKDIDYVEKVARDSMGVTKKGEIPVRIEK